MGVHRQSGGQRGRAIVAAGFALVTLLVFSACGAGGGVNNGGHASGTLQVVAVENFWGSIARQLGGTHVSVTSIVNDPNADPHLYQANTSTARTLITAHYVILNGAGYDSWASAMLNANPVDGRDVLSVARLLGKKEGDNPHFWYDPDDVVQVANQITRDYQALDPADATYYAQQKAWFLHTALKPYFDRLAAIKAQYAGRKVGATESIFVYMADYLGLNLTTPPSFMNAVAEGNDPPAAAVATFEQQVQGRQIGVLVYNTQSATNITTAVRQMAAQEGIPTVGVSETMAPASTTFQAWQVAQLTALQNALGASAMGQ